MRAEYLYLWVLGAIFVGLWTRYLLKPAKTDKTMPSTPNKVSTLPVGLYGPQRAFVAVLDPIQKRIFDPWGEHVITTWLDSEGEECDPIKAVMCVAHVPAGHIVDPDTGKLTAVMRWMSLQIKPMYDDKLH